MCFICVLCCTRWAASFKGHHLYDVCVRVWLIVIRPEETLIMLILQPHLCFLLNPHIQPPWTFGNGLKPTRAVLTDQVLSRALNQGSTRVYLRQRPLGVSYQACFGSLPRRSVGIKLDRSFPGALTLSASYLSPNSFGELWIFVHANVRTAPGRTSRGVRIHSDCSFDVFRIAAMIELDGLPDRGGLHCSYVAMR